MSRRLLLRDAGRALSLATLCYIAVWIGLLDNQSNYPRFNNCLGIILNELLLASVLVAAMTAVRVSRSPAAFALARWVFLLVMLIPLNGIISGKYGTQLTAPLAHLGRNGMRVVALAAVLVAIVAIVRWQRAVARGAAAVVLVLFPFFLITLGQAAWFMTKFADKPAPPPLAARPPGAPRIVWLLFDEMDQHLAFAARPPSVVLDELDRLRATSVYASDAFPPADYTMMSIPALIDGRLVAKAEAAHPAELRLTFADERQPVGWSTQPNVFGDARAAGADTALVGFYHPYCRIIGDTLTHCLWQDIGWMSLVDSMRKQVRRMVRTVPYAGKLPWLESARIKREQRQQERRERVVSYRRMLEDAKRVANDRSVGLAYIHWPVPHPPGIYDRRADALEAAKESSYLDNLRLVDRTLGELRRSMEAAGTWDDTTVLLTSDHWWRARLWREEGALTPEDEPYADVVPVDHHVPFLLKTAGQKSTVAYDHTFNTVLTRDLFLAILRGELQRPESIVEWLDAHRSLGESPYVTGKAA
jgi:hypothetical protein